MLEGEPICWSPAQESTRERPHSLQLGRGQPDLVHHPVHLPLQPLQPLQLAVIRPRELAAQPSQRRASLGEVVLELPHREQLDRLGRGLVLAFVLVLRAAFGFGPRARERRILVLGLLAKADDGLEGRLEGEGGGAGAGALLALELAGREFLGSERGGGGGVVVGQDFVGCVGGLRYLSNDQVGLE